VSRIAALPQRDWKLNSEEAALAMTLLLRTPNGSQTLRPVQGQALLEIGLPKGPSGKRGGYKAIIVGGGKTMIVALAATVLKEERAIVCVPGKLQGPTRAYDRKIEDLRKHWQIVPNLPVLTFEWLRLKEQEDYLFRARPRVIIVDECQGLKDPDGTLSRRIDRYMAEFPDTICVFVSGSPTKDSINDVAHQLLWCLGDGSPLPLVRDVWEAWARLVDAKVKPHERGELSVLKGDLGKDAAKSTAAARAAIRERMHATHGVIISTEPYEEVPLAWEPWEWEVPECVAQYYPKLRNEWLAPDDFPLTDAQTEVWAHANRLAVGLVYEFDPWPPKPWREARRAYGGQVRDAIEGGTYDTEAQVRAAILAGELPRRIWDEWQEIAPTHTPFTRKRIASDHMAEVCQNWLDKMSGRGLIYVHHPTLGRFLAKSLGLPFFHSGGVDSATGKHIESNTHTAAIASIGACSEGFNLQGENSSKCHYWNAFMAEFPKRPSGGQALEQLAGRFHRQLQTKGVTVYYPWSCLEHQRSLDMCMLEAWHAEETFGIPQKLIHYRPRRIGVGDGPAWEPPIKKKKQEDEDE
jgi:hypothetical protein